MDRGRLVACIAVLAVAIGCGPSAEELARDRAREEAERQAYVSEQAKICEHVKGAQKGMTPRELECVIGPYSILAWDELEKGCQTGPVTVQTKSGDYVFTFSGRCSLESWPGSPR